MRGPTGEILTYRYMKVCPFCSQQVQDDAIRCTNCLSNLSTYEAREKIRLQEEDERDKAMKFRSANWPEYIAEYLRENTAIFKRLQDKTDSEIIETVLEEKRESNMTIFYLLGALISFAGFIWLNVSPGAFPKILCFGLLASIWLHPEKARE